MARSHRDSVVVDELGFYSFRRARISGRWSGTHRQLPAYAVGDGEVLVWFSIDWVSFTSKLQLASHLHDDTADVRQRLAPIQLR